MIDKTCDVFEIHTPTLIAHVQPDTCPGPGPAKPL